jgi:hypothetical protein
VCPACGHERRVPDEMRPRGQSCFQCQRERKREKDRERAKRPDVREKARRRRRAKREWIYVNGSDEYERHLAYMREWRARHPGKQAEYSRRYRERLTPEKRAEYLARDRERARRRRERDPKHIREIERASRERLMQDPEWRERARETQRINYHLRREREQQPRREPMSEEEYLQRYGNGSGRTTSKVPVGPLRDVVRDWLDPDEIVHAANAVTRNRDRDATLGLHTRGELARRAGVDERRVYDLFHGAYLSLRVADRIATAVDVPLSLIYPNLR